MWYDELQAEKRIFAYRTLETDDKVLQSSRRKNTTIQCLDFTATVEGVQPYSNLTPSDADTPAIFCQIALYNNDTCGMWIGHYVVVARSFTIYFYL